MINFLKVHVQVLALSNIVAKRLDYRLSGLSKKINLCYTRYADDITFSGNHIPKNIISICKIILLSEGFSLNDKKTKYKSAGSKKVVTGLNVHNDKLTVQKKYKRELRKEIHFIKNHGLINHLKYLNDFDPMYIERLIGRLNFLLSVEPNNSFGINSLDYLLNIYKK